MSPFIGQDFDIRIVEGYRTDSVHDLDLLGSWG